MTRSTRKRAPRRFWTPAELKMLRECYPHESTKAIARELGASIDRVYAMANYLGLHKTPEYLAGPDACRLRRGDNVGKAFRFPPGHVPANKGLRRPGWAVGRMRETQFKKGQWPINKDPDFYVLGALRVNTDGYIDMRISFELGSRGWRGLHLILWEDAHGRIPRGYCLAFKDRDQLNVCLENIELISRGENMRRNTIHRLPPEIKAVKFKIARLTRLINERDRANAESEPA